MGRRILAGSMGNMLLTIILSSSVLYELIGPVCAKIALLRSGTIKMDNTTPGEGKDELKTEKVSEERAS